MEKIFKILALVFFTLFVEAISPTTNNPAIIRCSESCLKINPYENETEAVRHCAKLTPDGKCECDWEKILTSDGQCMCRNPQHSIDARNNCVCDVKKCSKPKKDCTGVVTAKQQLNDCCPSYSCVLCPNDSYRSNQTQDEECICYPCKPSNCKNNQTAVIIGKGNLKPSTCCDLYKCVDHNEKKSCVDNGITYSEGDFWYKESCVIFRCENGIIIQDITENCEINKGCFSRGVMYENLQSWMEDECTNCTCENGVKKCVAHFCKDFPSVTIRPKDDCPPVLGCKKTCLFGYRLNRRGCEMCKCRQPDFKTVQEILRAVNCTAESCDVLHVVPSNSSTGNNQSIEQCPKCSDSLGIADSNIPKTWPVILLTICILLTILCGILLWLLCRERRRAVCILHRSDPSPLAHPDQHKYLHIPMFDANLNTDKSAMLISGKAIDEVKDYR